MGLLIGMSSRAGNTHNDSVFLRILHEYHNEKNIFGLTNDNGLTHDIYLTLEQKCACHRHKIEDYKIENGKLYTDTLNLVSIKKIGGEFSQTLLTSVQRFGLRLLRRSIFNWQWYWKAEVRFIHET